MQKVSPSLCGSTRPRPMSCWSEMPKLVAERAEMLFDQAAVEAIVSGGHGRVRRENGVLGDFAEGVVERHGRRPPSARGSLRAWRTRCGLRSDDRRRARCPAPAAPARRRRRAPVPGECACDDRRRTAGWSVRDLRGWFASTSQSSRYRFTRPTCISQTLARSGPVRVSIFDDDVLAVGAHGPAPSARFRLSCRDILRCW